MSSDPLFPVEPWLVREPIWNPDLLAQTAWSAIVEGFGGLRQHRGLLALAPRLPTGITRLAFRIRHSGLRLLVDADHEKVQLRLRDRSDARIPVLLYGERVDVGPDEPVVRAVVPLNPLLPAPRQPAGHAPDPASPRQEASDEAS